MFAFKVLTLKPWPKLQLRSLSDIAKELHKDMFANFATGELSSVDKKLCSGLLTSLRGRIAQRPPNTSYIWKLHRYVTPPRLMSYQATVFPETMELPREERHGIVQAVVRIHSLQSLWPVRRVPVRDGKKTVMKDVIVSPQGDELPVELVMESSFKMNQKETVEYLVIQRMYRRAQPGPWMVWGTTEETSLAKLEKLEQLRKKGRMLDKGAAKGQVGV
jgi:protein MBA1